MNTLKTNVPKMEELIFKDGELVPATSTDDAEIKDEKEIFLELTNNLKSIEIELESVLYKDNYNHDYEIMMYQAENKSLRDEIESKNRYIRALEENILYLKKINMLKDINNYKNETES